MSGFEAVEWAPPNRQAAKRHCSLPGDAWNVLTGASTGKLVTVDVRGAFSVPGLLAKGLFQLLEGQ